MSQTLWLKMTEMYSFTVPETKIQNQSASSLSSFWWLWGRIRSMTISQLPAAITKPWRSLAYRCFTPFSGSIFSVPMSLCSNFPLRREAAVILDLGPPLIQSDPHSNWFNWQIRSPWQIPGRHEFFQDNIQSSAVEFSRSSSEKKTLCRSFI